MKLVFNAVYIFESAVFIIELNNMIYDMKDITEFVDEVITRIIIIVY